MNKAQLRNRGEVRITVARAFLTRQKACKCEPANFFERSIAHRAHRRGNAWRIIADSTPILRIGRQIFFVSFGISDGRRLRDKELLWPPNAARRALCRRN
jgi:hypothetical protein